MVKVTYNFREKDYDYDKTVYDGELYDARLGITCHNPTFDAEMLLNYYDFINRNRDSWTSIGYLDMGMMPFIMFPTFMQYDEFVGPYLKFLNAFDIHGYQMRPVSFFNPRYGKRSTFKDVWVFKEDVAKVMGIKEVESVTFEKFYRWCVSNVK